MRTRRAALTVTGALTLLMAAAIGAWACTPAATIALNVSNGPPGTSVEITGEEFRSNGSVEVYWEPTNDSEPQFLFEESGQSWTENTAVPENASSGTHYFKAYGYDSDGELRGTATASFTVPHGAVEGQVTAEGSGDPVHAAEVTVTRDGQVVGSDRTNSQGHFGVEDLEQGQHEVVVDRDGYQRSSAHTQVHSGETNQVNVQIARESQDGSQPQGSEGADGSDEQQSTSPQGSEGADGSDEQQSTSPQGSGGAATEADGSSQPEPEGSQAPDGSQTSQPEGSQPRESTSQPESSGTGEPEGSQAGEPDDAPTAAPSEPQDDQPTEASEPRGDEPAEPGEPATNEATGSAGDDDSSQAAVADGSDRQSAAEVDEDENTAAETNEADEPDEDSGGLTSAAEVRGETPRSDADTDERAAAPSARSSAADLWSGLDADDQQAAMTGPQGGETESVSIGQQLTVALGLLGAGLMLLAASGLVAVRRRHTPVLAHRSQ